MVLILCAVSVEAEATVENQGNWTNLGCSVAGEWSNAYAVNLQTIIVVVVVAYLDTESPLAVEVITDLWSYVECCMVVIGVTLETNFTTYKNLCAGCYSHYQSNQCKINLLHNFNLFCC